MLHGAGASVLLGLSFTGAIYMWTFDASSHMAIYIV